MANTTKLKELRKKARRTQQYIADKIGISQNNYSNIENGKVKLSEEYAIKLCDFYGCTIDELYSADEEVLQEQEQQLLDLFSLVPEDKQRELLEIVRRELLKQSLETLFNTIYEMSDEEVNKLSDYVNFIISQRK